MNSKASMINIGNRFVAMFGQVIIISFVLMILSPQLQGFYYTFNSLIALQFFAELGLGAAVVITVSHSDSKVKRNGLAIFFSKWYKVISIIFVILVSPAIFLFNEAYEAMPDYLLRIIFPWILLCLFTGYNLYINGRLAILEGAGYLTKVGKIRIFQTSGGILAAILTLAVGAELFCLVAAAFVKLLIGEFHLRKHSFFQSENLGFSDTDVNWVEDILPFQWRMGLSWIAGYFVFYFLTPLIMYTNGAVDAGKFGMAIQVVQAISSISNVWITTNLPTLSSLVSKNKIQEMEILFLKCFKLTFATFLSFASITLVFSYLASHTSFTNRVLDFDLILVLVVAGVCNQIFFVLNFYSRVFMVERLHVVSVLNALFTLAASLYYVPNLGLQGAVYIYFLGALLFSFLVSTAIIIKFRRKK